MCALQVRRRRLAEAMETSVVAEKPNLRGGRQGLQKQHTPTASRGNLGSGGGNNDLLTTGSLPSINPILLISYSRDRRRHRNVPLPPMPQIVYQRETVPV